MIFDTDVIVWVQRGLEKAARLIDAAEDRYISLQTYMELLQCAQSKRQHVETRNFLTDLNFNILPLTENIGHRAAIYIEEYSLANGLRAGDAIIAATAVEHNLTLASANIKHYKVIKDIKLKALKVA